MTARRTFLKLATATVGGAIITTYSEPYAFIKDKSGWITDKGDYYIVRVPDYKSFAGETMDKNTIFILGNSALVTRVSVLGFVNITAPNGATLNEMLLDSRGSLSQKPRPALVFENTQNVKINGSHLFMSDGRVQFGVHDSYA
jgi:hypothetical protein